MGTQSFIAKINPDGSIKGIYCHYDGYVDGVGRTLYDHYTTTEKVSDLVALGGIRNLGTDVGVKHDYDSQAEEFRRMTTAFHRDRGERRDSEVYKTLQDALDSIGNYEYAYFWDGECWFYCVLGSSRGRKLKVLSPLSFDERSSQVVG